MSTTEKWLIDHPPVKPYVVFVAGVCHEADNFREAQRIAGDAMCFAFWDCKDRKKPVFMGAQSR